MTVVNSEDVLGCRADRPGGCDAATPWGAAWIVSRRRRRVRIDPRRRLAAALPEDWVMPPSSWCRAHRHDVFYLAPSVRARTNHTHHKHADVVTCPPVCLTEAKTKILEAVKNAPRDVPEAWPGGHRAHWNHWDASEWREAAARAA